LFLFLAKPLIFFLAKPLIFFGGIGAGSGSILNGQRGT
jgi:hypothetical protein